MKFIFIVNPKAGTGDSEALITKALENEELKDKCEIYLTKGVGDATTYVENYIKEHSKEEVRFIACGGDGTINEVFNACVNKSDKVSCTCFPSGSGNDFVKCFGGTEPFMNVHNLLVNKAKKIDVLETDGRYSINVINFGFDTVVAQTINHKRDTRGYAKKSDYTTGVVTALVKGMKTDVKVIADGELLNKTGDCLLCTVANGQYVGGSFKCAPRAELDDGLIEVCLVNRISRLKFVDLLKPYTNGEHLDSDKFKGVIAYKKAKKVEVIATPGFAYSLDGEIIYTDHFVINILPKALNFVDPR